MSRREHWRGKAAQYLRWHRAALRSRLDRQAAPVYFRWYSEARHYADYFERFGENARAPHWYYPDS